MRIVRVNEGTYDAEYSASTDAIRDFLYMYFQIAGDCLPAGDFDRAELGSVDPFRYLDVAYEYTYQFRSKQEVAFLHEGAAINLLCHLAQAIDLDECSGSTIVADFRSALARSQEDDALQAQAQYAYVRYRPDARQRNFLRLPEPRMRSPK